MCTTPMESHLLQCTLLVLLASAVAFGADSPVLVPPDQVVEKNSRESWNVTCFANQPIVWDYRDSGKAHDHAEIQNETYDSGPYLYSSTLFIATVSVLDADLYRCKLIDDDSINASVLLAVADPKSLFATNKSSNEYVNAYVGTTVILPCRKSHPNISVVLSSPNEVIIDPLTTPGVSYNYYEGFIFESISLKDTGTYICRAKWGQISDEMWMYLHVYGEIKEVPKIRPDIGDGVKTGDTFKLYCTINIPTGTGHIPLFTLEWLQPEVVNSTRATKGKTLAKETKQKFTLYESELTVENATKEDGGDYVCQLDLKGLLAPKSVNYSIEVYDLGQEFIQVTSGEEHVQTPRRGTAKWTMNISAFPLSRRQKWLKNGVPVRDSRFNLSSPDKKTFNLVIKDVKPEDAGMYTFWASNDYQNDTATFNLTVLYPPELTLEAVEPASALMGGDYYLYNSTVEFDCKADGYPYPTVSWMIHRCDSEPGQTSDDGRCNITMPRADQVRGSQYDVPRQGTQSTLSMTIDSYGYVICDGKNELSNAVYRELNVKVVDFPTSTGFDILSTEDPVEKTDFHMDCAVSKMEFKPPRWRIMNGGAWKSLNPGEGYERLQATQLESEWSITARLSIPQIQKGDGGNYSCVTQSYDGTPFEKTKLINVRAHKKPSFISPTNLNNTMIFGRSGEILGDLICNADGLPKPTLQWLKDGVPSEKWESEFKELLVKSPKSPFPVLRIPTQPEYNGNYSCRADNGDVRETYMLIEYSERSGWSLLWKIVLTFLAAMVILVLYFGYKFYRVKQSEARSWKRMYQDLINGNPAAINPALPVSDQINLLPYDPRWEFSRDKLRLGEQLGGGAYGRVLKAIADGIKPDEDKTTVAVKMVKSGEDQSCLDALIGELKILGHLGQHVNVVNLLGACTEGFPKKHLYVIVEYCRFGNLRKYLMQRKRTFIDQRDPDTESYVCASTIAPSESTTRTAPEGYRLLTEIPCNSPTPIANNATYRSASGGGNPSGYYAGNNSNVPSCATETSYLANSITGGQGTSSVNGYDCQDEDLMDVEPISTTDLIFWTFQIASGMEYLATRHILHGDLAARNVLVAEDKIAKICDFGLSRQVYESLYKKTNREQLLPFHWMALESITDYCFSTKSDVWSFGVTMWEIFTLGQTPYPGRGADSKFQRFLKDGGRLEKPPLATTAIYDLMSSCWHENPDARPEFSAIVNTLRDMLDDAYRRRYLKMNELYDEANRAIFADRPDYLLQMAREEFVLPREPSPGYVNVSQIPRTLSVERTQSPMAADGSEYQNMGTGPGIQPLANNAGYVFMNRDRRPSSGISETETLPRTSPTPITEVQVSNFSGGNCLVLPTSNQHQRTQPIPMFDGIMPDLSASLVVETPGHEHKRLSFTGGTVETYSSGSSNVNNRNPEEMQIRVNGRKKNDSGFSSSSSEQTSDIEGANKCDSPVTENYVGNQGYFSPSVFLNGQLDLKKPDVVTLES